MKAARWQIILVAVFTTAFARAQDCSDLNISHHADIPATCSAITMTMLHDQLDRDYLYVANKEAGVTIYSISNSASPVLAAAVPIDSMANLQVMSVHQQGNYLFVSLGSHFVNGEQGGIAVLNITQPDAPVVSDVELISGADHGVGVIDTEGDYAYVGAMSAGLVVFDISNKTDIQQVGQVMPNINYPTNNPNPDLYNARGLTVQNGIAYLCFDAGGLRIINCTDPANPVETGRYSNPALHDPINLPRAYNNIVLDSPYAYVAVDYCGLEVLNISDTSNITLDGWWNPYNCPGNNWFTSPSHANELYFDRNCNHLFVSTGKSDMVVLDVTDPTAPDSCNAYGGVANNIGTWGISAYADELYLSYICALVPFSSNWSGVKILKYSTCPLSYSELPSTTWSAYPNPSTSYVTVDFGDSAPQPLVLLNSIGQQITCSMRLESNSILVDTTELPNGMYVLVSADGQHYSPLIVQH